MTHTRTKFVLTTWWLVRCTVSTHNQTRGRVSSPNPTTNDSCVVILLQYYHCTHYIRLDLSLHSFLEYILQHPLDSSGQYLKLECLPGGCSNDNLFNVFIIENESFRKHSLTTHVLVHRVELSWVELHSSHFVTRRLMRLSHDGPTLNIEGAQDRCIHFECRTVL